MYNKINFSCEEKENFNPNMTQSTRSYSQVEQEDFSKIGTRYVLDGERLRVKSINYKDERRQHKKEEENLPFVKKNIDEKEIAKLEYLEKMGVINEEEKQILFQVRNKKDSSLHQKIPISKGMNPFIACPYKSNIISQPPQNNVTPKNNYWSNTGVPQMNSSNNRPNLNRTPQFQNQDYGYPINNQIKMTAELRYANQSYETQEAYYVQPQCNVSQEDNEVDYSTEQQNYYY